MRAKNGFIATSLIYSFFLVFVALIAALLSRYISNKTILDRYNEEIESKLNTNTYSVTVRAKNANIENGTTLTNLVMNGNFSDKDSSNFPSYWNSEGNVKNFTTTNTWLGNSALIKNPVNSSSSANSYVYQNIGIVNGSKYYYRIDYFQNHDIGLGTYLYDVSGNFSGPVLTTKRSLDSTSWDKLSTSYESQLDGNIKFVVGNASIGYTGSSYFTNAMVINLTASFGKNYEPDTAWVDKNVDWFDGTINYIKKDGIENGSQTSIKFVPYNGYENYNISCTDSKGHALQASETPIVSEEDNGRVNYIMSFNSVTDDITCDVEFKRKYDSSLTLAALNLKAKNGNPDFNNVATTDETADGLYSMKDDYGTSYYFRGAVTNNYVKFANKFWRIVRINGDGSLRMIYDGTTAHANGEISEDRTIGKNYFNSTNSDNAHAGYMYGLADTTTDANRCLVLENDIVVNKVSTYADKATCEGVGGKWTTTAYEATHANVKSSTIKEILDDWYKKNIVDTGYSSYVSDEIFCNDKSVFSRGLGIGKSLTDYGGFDRTYNDIEHAVYPQLNCNQKNDAFTVSDVEKGNGDLTYPVGLLTGDEVLMAGAIYNKTNSEANRNKSFYLYNGYWNWTNSPFQFISSGYNSWIAINEFGNLSYPSLSRISIVPVINLSVENALKLKGTGTMSNPYYLD